MAKENTSLGDWNKKGWVEVDGKLVKSASLIGKKVDKIVSGIPMFNEAPKQNVKIKNATKSVNEQGVKFDSNLEKTMYNMLTAAKIQFEFQKTFVLQEKFRYRDENIRAIVKIVDFFLPTRNIIIDTKGFSNDVSPMKHKMLKLALKRDYNMEPDVLMPANKKDCENVLNRLLYNA